MPISHKSRVHQPIGYTSPVDLNLLGKVLQYKESQYDAGTQKFQSQIDSIASMDIAKDSDKQYVTAKLNNLIENVNSIGGADYSDPNVSNQIAGLSSQIYGDDKVVNAVANTKKLRYVQGFYKDLKEKKPKDYNLANEWYDMSKFEGWLSDGQVGTSTQGGSVTPYTKYQEDWQKTFDKIANSPNVTTEITDKGLMYRLDTHKVVSPDRIWETASKMLTPAQRQQLAIEGRYTYNALPISELAKAYDADTYKKIGAATGQLSDYKAKLKGATALSDQEKYQKLIAEKEAEVNALTAPVRKNADQIKENLYLGEQLKSLQARYAFQQSTSKLQAASDKMFKLKYEMDKAEFAYKQQNDALDRQVEIAKEGLMWVTDAFGNKTLIPDPNSPKNKPKTKDGKDEGYGPLPGLEGSLDEQRKENTRETLDNRKVELVKGNDELFTQFVRDLGRKKGLTDVIVTDLMDDGFIQSKVSPEMQKAGKEMMDSWQAMTRGEKINYDSLDPLFKGFASKYQQNQKEIEAIDKFYANVDQGIKEKYGVNETAVNRLLTAQQKFTGDLANLAQEYIRKGYVQGGSQRQTGERQQDALRIENEQKRLGNLVQAIEARPEFKRNKEYLKNRTLERDNALAASSFRYNLPTVTFDDDKDKNVAKMVAGNAANLQAYAADGSVEGKMELDPSKITVVSKGYAMLESGDGKVRQPVINITYKEDDKTSKSLKIPVMPNQALPLGFGNDVKDVSGFAAGLYLNGEVNDINTTSGRNYDLKYDIVKYDPKNQNDNSVFLRVKKGGNVISLYDKPFPTMEHAVMFMEGATKQKTADDAYKFLEDLAK